MTCPDLSALARAGTPRADPAVEEHLRTCRACWLDWQIQQGARYLHEAQVNPADDTDDLVVARATLIQRLADRPAGWPHLAASGLLVAMAVLVFLAAPLDRTAAVTLGDAALYALAVGILATLYFRTQDEKECGGPR